MDNNLEDNLRDLDAKGGYFFKRLYNKLIPYNYLVRSCCICKKKFKVCPLSLPRDANFYEKYPEDFKHRFQSRESFEQAILEQHRNYLEKKATRRLTFNIIRQDLYFFILPFFQWAYCVDCQSGKGQFQIRNSLFYSLRLIASWLISFVMFVLFLFAFATWPPPASVATWWNDFSRICLIVFLLGSIRILFTHGIFTLSRDKF